MRTIDTESSSPFRLRTFLFAMAVLVALLAVFLWLTQWSSSFEIHGSDITDVTEHTIESQRFPSGLTIKFAGHIDGRAVFETHDNRVTAIGPGPVNKTISGDYYQYSATVRYRPKKVTNGRLLVTYKFHYL